MNDKLHNRNKFHEINDINKLSLSLYKSNHSNTGDKSLNFRQEYNINIGKISLTKCNIPA